MKVEKFRQERCAMPDAIRVTVFETPLGLAMLAGGDAGIRALAFGDDEKTLETSMREVTGGAAERDDSALQQYSEAVTDHLAGKAREWTLPLDLRGTEFQRQVWAALSAIPFGETRNYAQLATEITDFYATRAVAGAIASNPVALIVPCHRVIGSDGAMHGYRWGVARKRQLLDWEAAGKNRPRAMVASAGPLFDRE
jgi:AraC family transcriptional regulator of adaptative response/methylated-DNA-[protein]-cysteine methyltransferase